VRNPTPQRSMRLFGFSITYVTLLFGALTLDVLVR
jgi:protoheme IX farnesyltransferase